MFHRLAADILHRRKRVIDHPAIGALVRAGVTGKMRQRAVDVGRAEVRAIRPIMRPFVWYKANTS
jgi:hypothetical protein